MLNYQRVSLKIIWSSYKNGTLGVQYIPFWAKGISYQWLYDITHDVPIDWLAFYRYVATFVCSHPNSWTNGPTQRSSTADTISIHWWNQAFLLDPLHLLIHILFLAAKIHSIITYVYIYVQYPWTAHIATASRLLPSWTVSASGAAFFFSGIGRGGTVPMAWN